MRKWIVEEIGEVRRVTSMEYYLCENSGIRQWPFDEPTLSKHPILRVTEITDQHFFLVDEYTGKQHGGPYKWEETAALARSQLENRSPDREWNLQITTYKVEKESR